MSNSTQISNNKETADGGVILVSSGKNGKYVTTTVRDHERIEHVYSDTSNRRTINQHAAPDASSWGRKRLRQQSITDADDRQKTLNSPRKQSQDKYYLEQQRIIRKQNELN